MTVSHTPKRRSDDTLQLPLRLISIGIALSAEKNHDRLLEMILEEAQSIANADGGTLYIRGEDDLLEFTILRNESVSLHQGGTSGNPIPYAPIHIHDPKTGTPNYGTQAVFCLLTGRPVNIDDVYSADGFDFDGTKAFDALNGYRSRSVLTIPMKSHTDEVIGVLQLVNAKDPATGEIIPFSRDVQEIVQSLASQAAVAINNQQLIQDQKDLLEAFIKVIAKAIDAKSTHTGTHCNRVPVIVEMLAEAACRIDHGPFKTFNMSDDEKYELHIAGWLHDCGKVVTPVHIMEKATKLETIFDRIQMINQRFELLKRDAEIAHLKGEMSKDAYLERLGQITQDKAFLNQANIGSEFLEEDKIARIKAIGAQTWQEDGEVYPFLNKDELHNLSLRRGTLTGEERQIINDHMVHTIHMLDSLPFPKHLQRVPEYACGHHEKMDGTGYPKGLTGDQMSIPAKMMAVADVFEALTAKDRPYKKAKTLSETMSIMGNMKRNRHFDPEVFNLFVESGVYREFAEQFLDSDQIDAVDEAALLAIEPEE